MIHHWYLAFSDEILTIEAVKQDNPHLDVWRVTVRHEEGGSVRYEVTAHRCEWIACKEPGSGPPPSSVINGFNNLIRRMNADTYLKDLRVGEPYDIDIVLARVLKPARTV